MYHIEIIAAVGTREYLEIQGMHVGCLNIYRTQHPSAPVVALRNSIMFPSQGGRITFRQSTRHGSSEAQCPAEGLPVERTGKLDIRAAGLFLHAVAHPY